MVNGTRNRQRALRVTVARTSARLDVDEQFIG